MAQDLKRLIRNVKDYPKPGVVFRDITTLLKNGKAFKRAVDLLYKKYKDKKIDLIAAVESRGFILGGALANRMGVGFIPVRKPGKLPYKTIEEPYQLEYGSDRLAIHEDAISEGERVLIVDDLLATGGTISATVNLVKKLGGNIISVAFVIELSGLKGRERLAGIPIVSLLTYD